MLLILTNVTSPVILPCIITLPVTPPFVVVVVVVVVVLRVSRKNKTRPKYRGR